MAERAKSKKAKTKKAVPKGATGSRGRVAKTDKPGIGHNTKGPSDALVLDHHTKIDGIEARLETAKRKYDQIRGELRSAYAVVKNDGIVVDDFKLARELDKRDHGSVVTGYANVGQYLRAIKSDLSVQMDLFADIAPPAPANATLAGAHAFANEEPRSNNPNKPGTEEYDNWDAAWMAAANATELKDGDGATIN